MLLRHEAEEAKPPQPWLRMADKLIGELIRLDRTSASSQALPPSGTGDHLGKLQPIQQEKVYPKAADFQKSCFDN
jgi:hypothetical protein